MTVEGETASGWAPVRDAVARVEADQGGALAVAAFHRGRPVVDLWAGTARSDALFHTWSAIKPTSGLTADWWAEQRGSGGSLRWHATPEGVDHALINGPEWRRGEVPAVNGHASARALAGFYARFLSSDLPAGIGQPGAAGIDLVLGRRVRWSLAGGQIDADDVGMGGIGGQWACARPGLGLAWAFLTSVMGTSDRAEAVERAILECASA